MSRTVQLLLGIALLGVAVWARPAPDDAEGGVTAALGRSMGGVRVMIIDGLFLRAESQRKAGRVEDAAALYETVLELDPHNEAATAFLAESYIQDLMPQIPDVKERFSWWQEARGLLAAAIQRRPDAWELHTRMANLILDPPLAHPDLEPRIDKALQGAGRVALEHLHKAVRGTETLPRLGRSHLVRYALLAPYEAGRALAAGDRSRIGQLLVDMAGVEQLRGDLLRQIQLDAGSATSLSDLLGAGSTAVHATWGVRLGSRTREAALQAVDAYDALLPDTKLVGLLRDALGP